jgi:hypothetical protein
MKKISAQAFPAMRKLGTRKVIWFECYSKVTDSGRARSYNTSFPSGGTPGTVGVIGELA